MTIVREVLLGEETMKRFFCLGLTAAIISLSIDAEARAQRRSRGAPTPAQPHYQSTYQNVDIQAGDEVRVRTLYLPPAYDDKGNPRHYTSAEKKALKGTDPKVPGYNSDFGSLKAGQAVKISLSVVKESKTTSDDAATTEKPAAKPKPPPTKTGSTATGGELQGVILKVDDATKKLTLRVDGLALAGTVRSQHLDKDTLNAIMADRRASLIVILSRDSGQR
jgi:hypothetical protein